MKCILVFDDESDRDRFKDYLISHQDRYFYLLESDDFQSPSVPRLYEYIRDELTAQYRATLVLKYMQEEAVLDITANGE